MSSTLFFQQLSKTIAEKSNLIAMDSCRLFHGRGYCYPGFEQVTVDWYAPVILVTFFKAAQSNDSLEWEQGLVSELLKHVEDLPSVTAVLVQRRYLQNSPSELVYGELPEKTFAQRDDLRFTITLGQRQNSGFFLDMEPGRQWLEERVDGKPRAEGKKLLNLFSYTCAFSVIAQSAGASAVVNVDMSRGALSQGRDNHRLNNLPTDNIKFLNENILKSWGRIRRPGPYDLAVIDPPSFQKGSFVAVKDYGKVLRRIPELMNSGAELLICLNAPELGEDFMQSLMQEYCPACQLVKRLPAHPDFPDADPDSALKLFHYRYIPTA